MSETPAEDGRSGTREALLDAAELLFADGGIQGTSLRAVTSEAEANLAAVNYHFGNKEGLVRAVFERRIRPVNEERLRLLSRLEATASDGGPALEDLVRAFVEPVMRMGAQAGTAHFKRLLARIFTEPGDEMRRLLQTQFEEVATRFGTAFAGVLPELPRDVLFWRFHFMLGSMLQVAQNGSLILEHSGGHCDPSRTDEVTARLVEFVSAGFRAQVPAAARRHKRAAAEAAEPGIADAPLPEDEPPDGTEGIFAWEDGY
jgi:AcrR family transcriptional regulator